MLHTLQFTPFRSDDRREVTETDRSATLKAIPFDRVPGKVAMTETILVVDDEESVRRTFREWLEGASLDCRLLTADDAESALTRANEQRIDLAILDWNLGAGNDGLKLLEDLQVFHPDIVAIMITGFADQATPVQAMRTGVRDYLDKNQDLNRSTFLQAVRRQLDHIRPARRERAIQQGLRQFHDALEKVLPLVQTTTTLQEPVPMADAARSILRALLEPTRARTAYLVVLPEDGEIRVHDATGTIVPVPPPPSGSTLAGLALTFRGPVVVEDLHAPEIAGAVTLFPFEQSARTLLAVPLQVGPRVQAILELFDPVGTDGSRVPFREEDRRLAAALAPLAEDLLRQALAERQTRQVLLDAIQTALQSSRTLAETLRTPRPEDPPAPAILDTIRHGLTDSPEASAVVRLAEAIRALSARHGPAVIQHCIGLVESLRALLDATTGGDALREGTGNAPRTSA